MDGSYYCGLTEGDLALMLRQAHMGDDSASIGRLARALQATAFEPGNVLRCADAGDVSLLCGAAAERGLAEESDRHRAERRLCGLKHEQVADLARMVRPLGATRGPWDLPAATDLMRRAVEGAVWEWHLFGEPHSETDVDRVVGMVGKADEGWEPAEWEQFWPSSCDWALLGDDGGLVGVCSVRVRRTAEGDGFQDATDPYDGTWWAPVAITSGYALHGGSYVSEGCVSTRVVHSTEASNPEALRGIGRDALPATVAVRCDMGVGNRFMLLPERIPEEVVRCWGEMAKDPTVTLVPHGTPGGEVEWARPGRPRVPEVGEIAGTAREAATRGGGTNVVRQPMAVRA